MKIFNVLTLFPNLFPGPLGVSIFKKSLKKLWDFNVYDLRQFGIGKNKVVDDEVYSGLAGMLIRPDVIMNAVNGINCSGKKIFLSPRGKRLNQEKIESLISDNDEFLILCGRYEGVDQRAIDYYDFEEISIGDYVISGGESACFVLLEAMIRKVSGVVGNKESFLKESFVDGCLSENRYTRPAKWVVDGHNIDVEEILLSGDHKKILDYQNNNRKKI